MRDHTDALTVEPDGAAEERPHVSRRRLLGLAGLGAGAVVGTQLPASVAGAADGDPLTLGQPNAASSTTALDTTISGPAFMLQNDDSGAPPNAVGAIGATCQVGTALSGVSQSGAAVAGHSQTGPGGSFTSDSGNALVVFGPAGIRANTESGTDAALNVINEGTGAGIHATADVSPAVTAGQTVDGPPAGDRFAILGLSHASGPDGFGKGSGVGVYGVSGVGSGVRGSAGSGIGINGNSESGYAVVGVSTSGTGVVGHTFGPSSGPAVRGHSASGIGGHFSTASGTALRVDGRAVFATAGSAVIAAGTDAVTVAQPAVSSLSHVSVTLVGDPGVSHVTWVERQPGSGFTVHLSSRLKQNGPPVPLTYLIVEALA